MYTDKFLQALLSYSDRQQQQAFLDGYNLKQQEDDEKQSKPALPPTLALPSAPPSRIPLESFAPKAQGQLDLQEEEAKALDVKPKSKSRLSLSLTPRPRGLQADILRLLYTGSATIHQLSAATKVYGSSMTTCLSRLRREGFVILTSSGNGTLPPQLSLTEAGLKEAAYFVRHPQLRMRHAKYQ